MNAPTSPTFSSLGAVHFFDDRWEQDRIQHFYFLDTPAYKKLSGLAKHVVLKGHRGTGKTTLMRALDWRERLVNDHLSRALDGEPFSDHVVGCFLQIKLLPVDMLDIWLRSSTEQIRYSVLSSYLRASWLVEACDALKGMNDRFGYATYGDEIRDLASVAETVWDWVPTDFKIAPIAGRGTLTLGNVREIAIEVMRYMRNAAAIELPQAEVVVARLDLSQFAPVVSALFGALARHVGRMDLSTPWMFRVCLDEGEYLSDDWAVAVRTLIRETDSPVYLAVSVLRSLGTGTRSAGASLSIDDREEVDLDDRPVEQMADLLNGIIRARLDLVGVPKASFDLRKFLGNPDVDDLLAVALTRSENRKVERLRNRIDAAQE